MKTLYKGKYLNFIQEDRWEYVKRNNCSGIVSVFPMKEDGTLIFIEQYRVPVKKWVIEFPAGLAGDLEGTSEEALHEAAQRELFEEVGYCAHEFIPLFEGPPSAGLSGETIHFFLAKNLMKVAEGGGEEGEEIKVHEVHISEIDAFLEKKSKEGILIDPKFYAGLYFLKYNYQPVTSRP